MSMQPPLGPNILLNKRPDLITAQMLNRKALNLENEAATRLIDAKQSHAFEKLPKASLVQQ